MRSLVFLALALPLLAQQELRQGPQQEPASPTIRASVPLVMAPVTVTDKKGKVIDGLTVDDFRLTDDGMPQKIRLDSADTVLAPVSLVILIQSSGISTPALARIERVGDMIQPLVTGGRGAAAVISFDDEIRVLSDFTADSGRLQEAFEGILSRSLREARLIDAVAEGVKMLDTRSPNNRRVMLILSESRDRGSKTKLKAAIELAQRAGVIMYPATYSVQASTFASNPQDAPPMPGGSQTVDILGGMSEMARFGKANAAEALARATGGRHLSFLTLDSLEKVITRTGEEIHSQYLLSFAPSPDAKEGFHQIQVAIPSHPEAVIRARPGYWVEKP